MKLKLFNGSTTVVDINVIGGGLDGPGITLIVQSKDGERAGTLTIDHHECQKLYPIIGMMPKPERVEPAPEVNRIDTAHQAATRG